MKVYFSYIILYFGRLSKEVTSTPNLDADDIIYLVTARGHDHRIKASHILGRFVSLERISRVLPPQD